MVVLRTICKSLHFHHHPTEALYSHFEAFSKEIFSCIVYVWARIVLKGKNAVGKFSRSFWLDHLSQWGPMFLLNNVQKTMILCSMKLTRSSHFNIAENVMMLDAGRCASDWASSAYVIQQRTPFDTSFLHEFFPRGNYLSFCTLLALSRSIYWTPLT